MGNWTPAEVWTVIAGVLTGIVLVSNAAEKVAAAWKAAKAPNDAQNARLNDLEARMKVAEGKLDRDHDRFESLDEGMHVTQRALLALLDHGLDGNNVQQMQDAKNGLQNYLINR